MAERSYIKGDRPVPDYRLVKFLGKGGFGEVWKAVGPGGIEVALKIIPLDNKQGFKEFRAIRMVKNVRSAHLVPIIGFWLKDSSGNLFDDQAETDSFIIKGKATELIIAMGLGEKSLMDRLEECQKEGKAGIPSEELLDYMLAVAKAIDYLNKPIHNSGSGQIAIQHCDVKPQNIMLVGGEAQLCDFGLARVLGDPRTTQSGNMMMSVPYTSPEMFEASKPSHSSDQYALAITYYELRTGELPFENPGNPASMMYQIMQGRLDLSRLTDPAEREVIKRATSLDPDKRYPASLEMVRELRRIIEGAVSTPPSKPTGPKPPPGPEAEGTEIVPGYRLIRRLGQGGYGTVWEAQAPGGKRVAIKIIHDVQGSSGRQEFRALEVIKSLDHEHLLDLHAYWLKDKDGDIIPDDVRNQPNAPAAHTLVIATKLASKNLLQRLNECQREGHPGIPVDELLNYMRQAAQAIDFLNEPRHRFGDQVMSIQHRDIKPENILLVGKTAKVGDFGLAKVLEGTNAQIHGSSTGYTPHYAAPELFRGEVTRWTDQYSLAITYFKLRTGRLPFEPNISLGDLLMMHLEGHLDLSALSETERGIIARATAAKADQRYPTCADMVAALERSLSGEIRQPKPPLAATSAEMNLPLKSPPLAGTPRRSTHPAAADAFTIKPEHDSSPVLVTTPEQEQATPDEELVHWHAETEEPARKTPIPEEVSAGAPDWRGGGVEQEKRPSTAELEVPDWRAGRPQQRKVPVGLLAALILLGGTGLTALGVYVYLNRAHPPTVRLGVTEDDVLGQIANKQFPRALVNIEDGTFGPAKKAELRDKVLRAWLEDARSLLVEKRDPKGALAQANSVLEHFPDNHEAQTIADQARMNLSMKLPPKTAAEEARDLLEQATASLSSKPAQALELFEKVANMPVSAELKSKAQLGQARAQARLGHWDKVRDLLPQGDVGPTERALRIALQLKATFPAGVDGKTEEARLVALLDQLVALKSDRDFGKNVAGQQEGTWVTDLGKQAVAALLAKINDVVVHAQQRTEPEINKALGWAEKIAKYDDANAGLSATTKQKAVQNLMDAADQIPREELKNPLLSPWKDHGETQVFEWLSLAYHLAGDNLPEKVAKDLIVAAGATEELEVARKVLLRFQLQKKPADIPYLLVKAKSQPLNRKGYQTAFETYADLLDLVLEQKDIPLRDRKKLLESALAIGELAVNAGNKDLEQRLATCYQAKIKFIQASAGSSLWPDEARELRESYAAALRHWPNPALRLEFSEFRREQALSLAPGSREQLDLLQSALKDLQAEPPDHPDPALVYHQRGRILEDLADLTFWEVKDKPGALSFYAKAIQAYDAAISKSGSKHPDYLLHRGRCRYNQFFASVDQTWLKAAEKDLADALAQHLTADQQNEAHQWLGRCLALQQPPDFPGAARELGLAFGDGKVPPRPTAEKTALEVFSKTTSYKMALVALGFVGNSTLNLYEKSGKVADRDTGVACCENLARYSRVFGDDDLGDPYEFLSADLLYKFGWAARRRNVPTKEILDFLKAGLPANLGNTRFTQLRLLNLRNYLLLEPFAKRPDQLNAQDITVLEGLLKDVETGVNLATGNDERYANFCTRVFENVANRNSCIQAYRTDVPFTAYLNAAQCCRLLKKKAAGLNYIRQALEVKGVEAVAREGANEVKQALEKLTD